MADAIRGKSVDDAIKTLIFSPQKSSNIVKKVLDSAIANAEHNLGADIDELKVVAVEVNEAPRFKRFRVRAKVLRAINSSCISFFDFFSVLAIYITCLDTKVVEKGSLAAANLNACLATSSVTPSIS